MPTSHDLLPVYLHLAQASQRRQRPLVRDKMLILAAVEAAESRLAPIAACCRQRVLHHNPGHLLRHYGSIADALADDRFLSLLKQLRRNYPREKAEHMLESLGIDLAAERATYYTDYEYAAALLGTTPDALEEDCHATAIGKDVYGENGAARDGSSRPDAGGGGLVSARGWRVPWWLWVICVVTAGFVVAFFSWDP